MSRFWCRWLTGVSVGTALAGLALAFGAGTPALAWVEGPLFAPFFGSARPGPEVIAFARFLFGVVGGLLSALGVFAAAIARSALARGEAWAWRGLALGLGAWFVVDTTASILAGVWVNVAGNALFAAAYALPLAVAARSRSRGALPLSGT